MGKVSAHGISVHGPEFQIHLIDSESEAPTETEYQKFMGRVNTPSGAKSIVNDAECAPAGSRFSFRFQWYDAKLTEADIVSVFAALPVIGLGSAKSLERGKFDIESLDIEMPEAKKPRQPQEENSSEIHTAAADTPLTSGPRRVGSLRKSKQ
jgi:hypothetical protein